MIWSFFPEFQTSPKWRLQSRHNKAALKALWAKGDWTADNAKCFGAPAHWVSQEEFHKLPITVQKKLLKMGLFAAKLQ